MCVTSLRAAQSACQVSEACASYIAGLVASLQTSRLRCLVQCELQCALSGTEVTSGIGGTEMSHATATDNAGVLSSGHVLQRIHHFVVSGE
jgi:hypothetical protein